MVVTSGFITVAEEVFSLETVSGLHVPSIVLGKDPTVLPRSRTNRQVSV